MSATTTKVKMPCQPSMTTGSRNCSSYNIRDKLITVKLFKLEDETVVLTDIIDFRIDFVRASTNYILGHQRGQEHQDGPGVSIPFWSVQNFW